MKAVFKGYISLDKNAVFAVEKIYNNKVIGQKLYELKDGMDADRFIIGETYEIEGLIK